jgi:hypothetical protein
MWGDILDQFWGCKQVEGSGRRNMMENVGGAQHFWHVRIVCVPDLNSWGILRKTVGGNESIFNVLVYILRSIHCKISPYLSKRFAVSRDFCSSRGLCFFPPRVGAAVFGPILCHTTETVRLRREVQSWCIINRQSCKVSNFWQNLTEIVMWTYFSENRKYEILQKFVRWYMRTER